MELENKSREQAEINFQTLFEAIPGLFLVLKPNAPYFTILTASNAYLKATMTERNKITGHGLFEVFPDNPDDSTATGTSNLKKSLENVIKNKIAHTMALQKYDIQRPDIDGGGFEERYWSPLNTPVLNKKNEVEYIIHRVEDVTEFELLKKKGLEELNVVNAELEEKSLVLESKRKRINNILTVLLGYTTMDFSQQLKVGDKADEIDAIAKGINKLGEEIQIFTLRLKENINELSDYKFALDESDIVAITNTKGIITKVNNKFCDISGYSIEELIGQDHRIINSGYHSKEFIRDLWVTIANGKIWKGDIKNKAKNGTYYWVDTTIVPFLDEQGKPYQYLAIRADITERKRTEEQLQAVNNELEAFSYSVSHDLRAPLRAVDGYAGIMKEDYGKMLDEEGNRLLRAIQHNAKKMGDLIDDLLAFSRLGKKEITKTNINMNELIKRVLIDINKSTFHNTKINIATLHKVKADNSLLHQVMFNLISNAIKYSSKKEQPVVEISSEEKENEIFFTIKDNGAGFDMRFVHKLFGVFQRLHSQGEFDGTGVGLAIVKRIIVRHGGKIWAEGEVDKGAIFRFALPIN